MNKKVILAYIDLLGFSEYVKTNQTAAEFKIKLEGVFDSVRGQLNDIIRHEKEEYRLVSDYLVMDMSDVEFIMFSDSLIIWLDMGKRISDHLEARRSIGFESFDNAEQEREILKIHTVTDYRFFLNYIAMTVFMLTCETHLLARGGIADGDFHCSTFGKDIKGEFLFSQALIDAFNLEKNARMPRIIISDKIHEKLKDCAWMDHSLIWTDADGENVLDIYHFPGYYKNLPELIDSCFKGHLNTSNKDSFHNIISKRLNELSSEKEKKRDIWNKWFWFKEYHNKRMQEIDKRFVI
ncbi:MAG: hypothetical protein AB7S78_13595 [Candidatus Omnitrophota bacterium]